jgi:hypothetical protein
MKEYKMDRTGRNNGKGQPFLKTKINLHYIYRFSSYRAANTARLGYKDQSVNFAFCREIISIYSEKYKGHINSLCVQNVEFLNVKT